MLEIHYSDAILSILFGGLFGYLVWNTLRIMKHEQMDARFHTQVTKHILRLEKKFIKHFKNVEIKLLRKDVK